MSLGTTREPQRQRKETLAGAAEPLSILFPPKPSIYSHREVLAPVFPQLVFKADQAKYERLREVNVLDNSTQILFQVNIYLSLVVVKYLFEIFNI